MARPSKSRNAKRPPSSSTKPPPPNGNTNNKKTSSPFTTPSQNLQNLLSTFPPSHIYILHQDPTPPSHRRQIFLVPLLFNTLLLLLLTYRLTTALPTYLALFASILGYQSPSSINLPATPLPQIIQIIAQRMAMFTFDGLILARYVAEWPLLFFWGGGSSESNQDAGTGCMGCRLRIGFPPAGQEVIVRRSRRWASDIVAVRSTLLSGISNQEEKEKGKTLKIIKTATAKPRLRSKSGMSLIDSEWDLYYSGMVAAHALTSETSQWTELEKAGPVICVFDPSCEAWRVWRPWDDDDNDNDVNQEEGGGSKLRRFKDLLTAMGREGLFFRWVELMQYETHSEGAFTEARREKAIAASRTLFAGVGVNWDEVIDGIGGLDGLPGMEITS